MKRLTGKYEKGRSYYNIVPGESSIERLAAIEDILGDDYDLGRLRELVELTKNIPHVCRFCVGCEMEPKDGHGCDEYDSFVFSTRRLRELVEADREGRCVVRPCKIGDTVYEIRCSEENESKRKYARKKYDYSVSAFTWKMKAFPEKCYVSEKKCTKSDFTYMGRTVFLTREAAEAALKGEQDGSVH